MEYFLNKEIIIEMKNIISANANRLILVVNNAISTNTTAMINNDNDNFFIITKLTLCCKGT